MNNIIWIIQKYDFTMELILSMKQIKYNIVTIKSIDIF